MLQDDGVAGGDTPKCYFEILVGPIHLTIRLSVETRGQRAWQKDFQSFEMNWVPWSETMEPNGQKSLMLFWPKWASGKKMTKLKHSSAYSLQVSSTGVNRVQTNLMGFSLVVVRWRLRLGGCSMAVLAGEEEGRQEAGQE